METVLTRFVGRSIVTDGTFVYNCSYVDRLQAPGVVRQILDTVLLGVIGEHEKIELPKLFNGYPIKLVGRVHVYRKGSDFPELKEDWVCLPTRYRPDTWNLVERYFPNEHSLIELKDVSPAEVVLGKTKMGEYAFAKTSIRKAMFSASPRKIPNYTFQDCRDLEQIELADGLERIGSYAFSGCKKLRYLVLPSSVNYIQEGAFRWSGLKTVVLSSKMEKLNNRVFADCAELETVVIPPSIHTISSNTFKGSPKVQIVGCRNSFAETYAKRENLGFVKMDELIPLLEDGAFSLHLL